MATNEEKLNTSNSIGFGNVNNQGVINSDILNNDNGSDFNTFSEPPIPTVNVPEVPQSQLTSTEQQAQTLSEQMIEANQALLGESSFRTKQEKEQGIPELLKTQTDLQNRINELISEQKAIPLQIQQESIGMGRTVGGAAPLQTARLRENAINALSTSALLQSTQGNIATAQTLVDRAVEAKYGPERERLNTLEKNLKIIQESPQYTLEQKNRATEQEALIEERKIALEDKRLEEKAILELANEGAKFGLDTLTLNKIQSAESLAEANQIAKDAGMFRDEETINEIATKASELGFGIDIISRIQNAKNEQEALRIATEAGVYTKAKEEELRLARDEEETGLILDGYQKIYSPEDLAGLSEEEIIRLPDGRIFKKPPEEEPAPSDYQFKETDKGNFVFNPNTGELINTDVAQGIVGGYYIGVYATDPNHEKAVASILQKMGKLTSSEEINNYIQTVAPGSPITAEIIRNTSEKYGVEWEMLIAMMQQDSSLGTKGLGARNNNPGNIAQFDSLGTTPTEGYKTLQEGVDAVGSWLNRHRALELTSDNENDPIALAQTIFNGTGKLSDISTADNLRGKVGQELGKMKDEALEQGDMIGVMKASAGGKDLDATTIQSLEKAFNVIGQISELQKSIKDEATGPFTGIIRSNNPYDVKAQQIKSQLTALVPNLARGIYGEVGVLTDNDVALYSRTLPNLTSPEELQDALLGITLRSVQRSIENKIKVNAGAGRDVSGMQDIYTAIKAQADAILEDLEGNIIPQSEFIVTNDKGEEIDLSQFEN